MGISIPTSDLVLLQNDHLQQNKDIRGGKAAMYTNRLTYFKPLEGQNVTDESGNNPYDNMVWMAPLFVLYPKVVDGFIGTIFQKPPILEGTDFDVSNVDLLGNSLDQFSEKVTTQVLENGYCASIIDWSNELKKAYFKHIEPEQFVSFTVSNIKGYPEIVKFIYKIDIEKEDPDNEFKTNIYVQKIVYDIFEGKVRVRIYEEKSEKSTDISAELDLVSTTFPTNTGSFLQSLPIVIHGKLANNFTIQKSPLQDISDLNISLNQRSIDQVYMLHWTALPTPWITGIDPDDPNGPTTIGPTSAWRIAEPEAKVGMLEFSGSSARAHQDYIDNLKETMAAIGAQILKKDAVSRETATSVLIRTNAQTSLISTIVNNISSQILQVLTIFLEWNEQSFENLNYELNDDFVIVDMEPNAQIALVKSWLDGAISHQTMFDKMKQGEIVPPKRTLDEEIELIKKYPPPFPLEHTKAKLDQETTEKEEKDDTTGSSIENGKVYNAQATS